MTMLRDGLLGGWELSSFTSRNVDTDEVSRPLGEHPHGLILYTADGYMSAQLAPETSSPDDDGQYIAYGGRFHVNEDTATVHHDVTISILPELLQQPQYRDAHLDGDQLALSATATNDGVISRNTLTWRRIRSETSDAARHS
jgi:hypothetical protein